MKSCTSCGAKMISESKFCSNCGKENVQNNLVSESNYSDLNMVENDTELFVGKKYDYYSKQWSKKAPGFNWGAAIFGIFWLGYRKMYKYLFVTIGILMATSIISLFVNSDLSEKISAGTSLVLIIVLGMFGTSLYQVHTEATLQRINKEAKNNEERTNAILKRGGTGIKHAFAALGLLMVSILVMLPIVWVTTSDEVVYSDEYSIEDEYLIEDEYDSEEITYTEESEDGTYEEETSVEATDLAQTFMMEQDLELRAIDVQFDMVNSLDQEFAIVGIAELDTYYNYGFSDIESEYFSISFSPIDPEYWDSWNLYFNREEFATLYEQLKNEGQLVIAAKGMIPSEVYEDSQGNLALGTYAVWE